MDAKVVIVRVYDDPGRRRGEHRVLVDRLWPRGLTKEAVDRDEWAKDLAPSTELRQEFHANPEDWRGFQRKYRAELRGEAAQEHLATLAAVARRGRLTLLSAAKDGARNHVAVLQKALTSLSKGGRKRGSGLVKK